MQPNQLGVISYEAIDVQALLADRGLLPESDHRCEEFPITSLS